MARGGCRGPGGRIHVHQRNVDDKTQTIRGDIVINHEHLDGIIETEQRSMEDKTRREYRNRIKHIIDWLMVHYPTYFEEGTRLLSEDEKQEKVFFAHNTNRDLCYSGLNVQLIKAFLSSKKKKKIHPVTGAVILSSSYKKEHKVAKKERRTDEQEADPISSTLFRMICSWAVNEGNIFVWVFSLAMWNLMSRSISIDGLAFHHIKSGMVQYETSDFVRMAR
ncbi:hypothetical protein HJC23_001955 [Cyclotella cryptica]|uniref:Uncharacterized protein n=1 Tax=Cyclotella cryptica TaxID=29204 RepID=A0ABD3PNS9_9STRA